MGGTVNADFTIDTNILIAQDCDPTPKYRVKLFFTNKEIIFINSGRRLLEKTDL